MGRFGDRERDRDKEREKSVWTPKGKRDERPEMIVKKKELKDLLEHKK